MLYMYRGARHNSWIRSAIEICICSMVEWAYQLHRKFIAEMISSTSRHARDSFLEVTYTALLTPRPRVKWVKAERPKFGGGLKYKRSEYYFSFLTQDTVLDTTYDAFSERTIGLPHAIYELAVTGRHQWHPMFCSSKMFQKCTVYELK